MKIACPNCNCLVENPALVEGLYRCTACGEWFNPDEPWRKTKSDSSAVKASGEPAPQDEAQKIRRNASTLAAVAGFFAVAGFIVGLVAIVSMKSGEDATGSFILAGSLIGVALWFYLIAQIVHIRALLARK
jgi:hypothetical protein